jgi:ABC-2 type transport system ATP-binding protein
LPDVAVSVQNVSKTFRLYHERATSLKERIVNRRRAEYEDFWAVRNVSLDVMPGETFGLVGPNGSGKSTLLKMIGGIILPNEGRITTRGRIASLLELGAGFHPDLTGRENVYLNASILGLTRKDTDRNFDAIVAFAELEDFIDMQVRHYSSGMYVRLGFAVAIHVDPQILLVDEVLSVGDEAFQRKCIDRIKSFQRQGRTIVFVTHAADTVPQICNAAAFIFKGNVEAIGDPSEVVRAYRRKLHGEAHLEAAPGEERGDKRVRIEKVTIADAAGGERSVFHSGEELQISVDVDSKERIDDVMVGVAIYDERDTLLIGTNTDLEQHPIEAIDGRARIRFRLSSLPMQEGRYAVTVGVTTRDHRHVYHWFEKAFSFRCDRTNLSTGSLAIPVTVSVERQQTEQRVVER